MAGYRDKTYLANRKRLLADEPVCYYCRRRKANTADHVIELDRWNAEGMPGDPHGLENLVPACYSCNSSRGATYGNAKRSAARKARQAGVQASERARRDADRAPVFSAPADDPGPPIIPLSGRGGGTAVDDDRSRSIASDPAEIAPRLRSPSWGARSHGLQVAAWAETHLGRTLYPWQVDVVTGLLEHHPDGDLCHRWGLVSTARQNGKTVLLSALIGWWLTEGRIVRGEPQSVLSVAHELRAAEEIHYVLAPILEEVFGASKSFSSFGRKEVRWEDGTIWRISSATPAAGHGQSNDLLLVDELWDVDADVLHAGLLPTQRARRSPLAAFFSTAGTEKSTAFLRWREQGLDVIDKGEPDRLFMAEWSPPPNVDLSDRSWWYWGNPSIGHGHLTIQDLEDEARGPDHGQFLRAGLNLWIASDQSWLDPGEWDELRTDDPPPDMTVLAVDSSRDGSRFVGLLAGPREDGTIHVAPAFVTRTETDAWAEVRKHLPPRATLAITPPLEIHAPPETASRRTVVGHGEILKWTSIVRGMIREGNVSHPGHTILDEHVGRAVGYTSKQGMGLSSDKSPGPIELARCLVWAVALASRAKWKTRPAVGGMRR